MKKSNSKLISTLLLLALLISGGCGLAANNEDRIERASAQMENGDYRAAMIELKNVLASDVNDATARLLLAKVSLGLGDVLAAEKELSRAADLGAPESEIRPLHYEILLAKGAFTDVLAGLGMETTGLTEAQQLSYRGKALLALGNAEAAVETFSEWLDAESDSVEAAVGLADAQATAGDIPTAIASLRQVVQTAPADFAAWHSLGLLLARTGDHAGAEEALIKAADTIKPQAHVVRYSMILAALTESELILDKRDAARRSLERLSGVSPNSPFTLWLSARLARAENDYALAARHLQKLLNITPDNVQAQLFLAQMQLLQGNSSQAESLLQRVIARSPDNLQARKLLAEAQLRRAEPGGAIEALAPLLEEDTQDAGVYTMLAQASLQQGNSEEAIRRLRKAVALAPDEPEPKLNLATALLNSGQTESALELLAGVPEGSGAGYRRERLMMTALVAAGRQEEADAIATGLLESHTADAMSTAIVADHYLRTDRTDEARQAIQALIASNPDNLDAKNALARLEFSDGNDAESRKLYSSVLKVDPDNLIALLGSAQAEQKAGNTDRMIELVVQAAEAHPDATEPRMLLANYYLRTDDLVEAEKWANELVTVGVRTAYASNIVANVFLYSGRLDEAVVYFQRAATLAPSSPQVQMGLARTYLAQNESDKARTALNNALELAPGWPVAMTVLTLVELRQGRLEQAQELVAKLRAMHPDNVSGMVLEGEVYAFQEDFAAAAAAYRLAVEKGAGRSAMLKEYQTRVNGSLPDAEQTLSGWLEKNTDDAVARAYLAQHYQRTSSPDESIRQYESVLEQDPDNVAVLNNLAWQYQQAGDLDRAVMLAERAYELNSSVGSIADTLGWIYYDRGELDKSVKLLSEASKLSPDNGEIQYHYAVVLSNSGDTARAKAILEKLKASDATFSSRTQADELLGTL